MNREQAEALIAELGTQLGMPDLALDPGGSCTLFIDDGAVIVTLGYNISSGTIDLMTCLDAVDPSSAQLSRLLAANFGWMATGGGCFALDPTGRSLVLQRRLSGSDVENGGLRSAIEGLVTTAEAWTKRLVAMAPAGDPIGAGTADVFDPIMLAGGGIRA